MSNKVGELYNSVIESVIKATKTEFEDTGDDTVVLDMLMKAWRKRLGEMNVIKDPGWDAEARKDELDATAWSAEDRLPDTLAIDQVPLPGPLPVGSPGQLGAGAAPAGGDGLAMGNDGLLFNLPPVKSEAGDARSGVPMQPQQPQQPPQHQYPRSGSPAGGGDGSTPVSAPQHPLYVKNESLDAMTAPEAQGSGFNPLNSSSTPGPGRSSESATATPSAPGSTSHSAGANQLPRGASLSPELQRQLQDAMNRQPRVPQTDGPQDEELNSDLDDSEDELIDSNDDEEGEQTQIMLCLYEKVHKVKTRWKYTLKDGVANVNGLDYVFARANGESEW